MGTTISSASVVPGIDVCRRRCRIFGVIVAAALLSGTVCAQNVARTPTSVANPFDPRPWLEDLEQTKQALAAKYANLEWAVLEREIDLTALFADTQHRIEAATDAAEARAAFDRLIRKVADGHVEIRWHARQTKAPVPPATCAALGYDAGMFAKGIGARIPGYSPVSNPTVAEYPAGTVRVASYTVGVVQIGIFTPQGIPALCEAGLKSLGIAPSTICDDRCEDRIEAWASDRMSADLARQLQALKALGASIILVDLTNNGGGTEWAEAAARIVTPVHLKSERLEFVRGDHWATAFGETEVKLRKAAETTDGADRGMLLRLADDVEGRRRAAESLCDSTPLWHLERPTCQWLGQGFYASGLVDSDSEQLRGKPWANLVFTPANFHYTPGAWAGPLIVLVNGYTGSAAEEFAAVLQDNHAAVIMGTPTVGAGCGHTDGGTPTILENSRGVLEVPDCARIRADGTNEVAGIQPDVLVGLRTDDGPGRNGTRVAEKLSQAVETALRRAKALNLGT
jgi:hypothetical protein